MGTAGPTLAAGDGGAPPNIDQSRGRARVGQGLAATPRGGRRPPNTTPPPRGDGCNPHGGRPAVPPGPAPLMPTTWAGGLSPPVPGRAAQPAGADHGGPRRARPHTTSPSDRQATGGRSPAGRHRGPAGRLQCRLAFLFRLPPSTGANNAAGAIAPDRDGGAAGLVPGGLAARAAGGAGQEQGPPLAGGGAALAGRS